MGADNQNGGGNAVYDDALEELEQIVSDPDHRTEAVDQTVLSEARGHDIWALHTNLTAVAASFEKISEALDNLDTLLENRADGIEGDLDTSTEELRERIGDLQSSVEDDLSAFETNVEEQFGDTIGELQEGFQETQSLINEEFETTQDQLDDGFETTQDKLASESSEIQEALTEGFDQTRDDLASESGDIQDTVSEGFEGVNENLDERASTLEELVDAETGTIQEIAETEFEATQEQLEDSFEKTQELLTENFEATNDETKSQVKHLRQELNQLLDKRFNHIDQTFASLRADLEVLKSLQMELIKERIGRTELVDELEQ